VQVAVLPISDEQAGSAHELAAALRVDGIRAEVDTNETLNYRIREAETRKIPFMAVVGKREAEAGTVAVRIRGAGRKQVVLPRAAFAEQVREGIRSRSLELLIEEG
jgi:threonyl-tRNA synthetase